MTITPVAPRTAARPPAPPPRRRRRRRGLVFVVALVALLADVVAALTLGQCRAPGVAVPGAYTPAFDRTLEHAGGTTPLTASQIDKIAGNAGVYTFSKFSANWNLEDQFADARKLAAAAERHGNDLKIFEYYNTSFWYEKNDAGWGSYGSGFNTNWYLKDTAGKPIPFYGIGNSQKAGDDSIGYVIDLSNANYRAWAVKTVVAWMKAAPLAGINFDSAQPMVGDVVRGAVGDSRSTYDELLCGTSEGDCARVDRWNAGMRSLLQAAEEALRPLGGTVVYNGVETIDDTTDVVPDRNLGLMQVADGANNEDFCMKAEALSPDEFTPLPVKGDIDMMVAQNADGKIITQITNYQTDGKIGEGPYCLGAFLMGWEPGLDYWSFHENYNDPLAGDYPKFPEVNLALGAPTGAYTDADGLMTRSFGNGFVAVNTGTGDADVTLPATAVEFSGGLARGTVDGGGTVTVEPRQARFFLWSSFVGTTTASSGGGCSR